MKEQLNSLAGQKVAVRIRGPIVAVVRGQLEYHCGLWQVSVFTGARVPKAMLAFDERSVDSIEVQPANAIRSKETVIWVK